MPIFSLSKPNPSLRTGFHPSWVRLRWVAKISRKQRITITIIFGFLGLLTNLMPLSLAENLDVFLGSLFWSIPAMVIGPLPGMISGAIASVAFAISEYPNLHFSIQLTHTLLLSSAVKSSKGREYLLEICLAFWLLLGCWFFGRFPFVAQELTGAKRLAITLASIWGTVNGTSIAFGFLLLIPVRIWRELIPLSSYLNRMSAGIMTTVILVVTTIVADHFSDLAALLHLPTSQATYDIISAWLTCMLIVTWASLITTRLITLPLAGSLKQLVRLSAATKKDTKTLAGLREFRPRVYEFNLLRRHFHRAFGSLHRTICSLQKAQTRISDQNKRLIEQRIQMEITTKKDFLTGLLNLRSLESHMAMIWPLVRSGRIDIGILLIDMDYFKHYNDTYGHLAGNNALADLAPILLSNVRSDDIVVRFGGEEFVVVAHCVNIEQCRQLAERIRKAVETSKLGITVSIGCAQSSPEDASWQEVLDRADKALYRAKKQGKNRVESEPRQ